jgi:hypothetical protein
VGWLKQIIKMKKPLAIQLEFDIKSVRRALALITGEAMTDEEIIAKFFDREAVKVDTEEMLGESEAFQICAAFLAVIMADGQPKKEPKKSKFQERLEQMAAERGKK